MDEEENVSEIICADADPAAVDNLVKILKKGKGKLVDASDIDSICLLYTSIFSHQYSPLVIIRQLQIIIFFKICHSYKKAKIQKSFIKPF